MTRMCRMYPHSRKWSSYDPQQASPKIRWSCCPHPLGTTPQYFSFESPGLFLANLCHWRRLMPFPIASPSSSIRNPKEHANRLGTTLARLPRHASCTSGRTLEWIRFRHKRLPLQGRSCCRLSPLTISRHGTFRSSAPFDVVQTVWNGVAVGVVLVSEILGKPTLFTNLHCEVIVPLVGKRRPHSK